MDIQSLIIPAMGPEEFKKEFANTFQDLIDNKYKMLDVKYQMSSVYDSKEDQIASVYSALIMYYQEENQQEEEEL